MNPSLLQESEKLARSWMRLDAAALRDYLIAEVEDPRLNLQSILSRHFIVQHLFGQRFRTLMLEEHRFSAVMNTLLPLLRTLNHPDDAESVLHALDHDSDNAEGIEIPQLILETYQALQSRTEGIGVPNYIETTLRSVRFEERRVQLDASSLNTFQDLWSEALQPCAADVLAGASAKASVLEPACGSANDYRFLHSFGLLPLIDYRGFDLCEKNISNAHEMFPGADFAVGNVFAIDSADRAWNLCFVHDLLEHLSIEGMTQAVAELCRVTRGSLCVHFFNMDEIPEHVVHPVEEYHWNRLSMGRMKELFASNGLTGSVVHIGSYVRHLTGCEAFPNPNAYTFYLARGV